MHNVIKHKSVKVDPAFSVRRFLFYYSAASSGPDNVVRYDFFFFREWIISVCSRQSLSPTSKLISFNSFKSNAVWPAKQTDNEWQHNRAHYLYYLVPCNLCLSVSERRTDHTLRVRGFVHAETKMYRLESVCCYSISGRSFSESLPQKYVLPLAVISQYHLNGSESTVH